MSLSRTSRGLLEEWTEENWVIRCRSQRMFHRMSGQRRPWTMLDYLHAHSYTPCLLLTGNWMLSSKSVCESDLEHFRLSVIHDSTTSCLSSLFVTVLCTVALIDPWLVLTAERFRCWSSTFHTWLPGHSIQVQYIFKDYNFHINMLYVRFFDAQLNKSEFLHEKHIRIPSVHESMEEMKLRHDVKTWRKDMMETSNPRDASDTKSILHDSWDSFWSLFSWQHCRFYLNDISQTADFIFEQKYLVDYTDMSSFLIVSNKLLFHLGVHLRKVDNNNLDTTNNLIYFIVLYNLCSRN